MRIFEAIKNRFFPEKGGKSQAQLCEVVRHLNERLMALEKAINVQTSCESLEQEEHLPIHFFTIVLNGNPFIRYHEKILSKLPLRWHWHIVEGVAHLNHDTGWALSNGGRIPHQFHKQGRSTDGTSEYLDELKQQYPVNITIYRKPHGEFWDGKREMVNAPLKSIEEECLLWEIDSDELWTAKQILSVRKAFANNRERSAAFYWCWYFIAPEMITVTRNTYSNYSHQDWLRTWRYKPGDYWAAHEPPILVRNVEGQRLADVGKIAPFKQYETEAMGAVFQHFAYATERQVSFKEIYYGYENAVSQWRQLQSHQGRGLLRNYFAWVTDDTEFDVVGRLGIDPLARKKAHSDEWTFIT